MLSPSIEHLDQKILHILSLSRSNYIFCSLPVQSPFKHPYLPTSKYRTNAVLDELGKFIEFSCVSIAVSGLDSYTNKQRGQPLIPTLLLHMHPVAPLVKHIAKYGAPVENNLPSTHTSTVTSLRRGVHIAAKRLCSFIRMELLHQAKAGYVTILPFSTLQHFNNLLISPVAVILQDDHKLRLIFDYSSYGIDNALVDIAPTEAMKFGKAFYRIISKIQDSYPKLGSTQLYKIALVDGYVRVPLSTVAVSQLVFIVPSNHTNSKLLIEMYSYLPMEIIPSCSFFEAVTETIVDIVNNSWSDITYVKPHRLSTLAGSPLIYLLILKGVILSSNEVTLIFLWRKLQLSLKHPQQNRLMYIDDHLLLSQGYPAIRTATRDYVINTIDSVFK